MLGARFGEFYDFLRRMIMAAGGKRLVLRFAIPGEKCCNDIYILENTPKKLIEFKAVA
jgi:hypothetical protein